MTEENHKTGADISSSQNTLCQIYNEQNVLSRKDIEKRMLSNWNSPHPCYSILEIQFKGGTRTDQDRPPAEPIPMVDIFNLPSEFLSHTPPPVTLPTEEVVVLQEELTAEQEALIDCVLCEEGRQLPYVQFMTHCLSLHNVHTNCPLCSESFTCPKCTVQHLVLEHSQLWTCFVCRISLPSLVEYSDHMAGRHRKSDVFLDSKASSEEAFVCRERGCGFASPSKLGTALHVANTHRGTLARTQLFPFPTKLHGCLFFQRRLHTMLTCALCGFQTTTQTGLARHRQTHFRESGQSQCRWCGEWVSCLITHYKKQHQDKKLLCEACPRTFWQEQRLNKHRMTHINLHSPESRDGSSESLPVDDQEE